jgi:hypothetical protein
MNLPQRSKVVRKGLRVSMATLLALIMVASAFPVFAFAPQSENIVEVPIAENFEITLTEEMFEAFQEIQTFNAQTGLIGFEGDYALPEGNELVNVIVYFETATAAVQVVEAAFQGLAMTIDEGDALVDDNHNAFRGEINRLFAENAVNNRVRTAAPTFNIHAEFRYVLSGVGLTVSANMVSEVAELPSVRAIMPDVTVYAPDTVELELWYGDNEEADVSDIWLTEDEYEVLDDNDPPQPPPPVVYTPELEASISAARRTITVSLTEGSYAANVADTVEDWNLISSVNTLGDILEVHRISDREVRVVTENHAALDMASVAISAPAAAFAGDTVPSDNEADVRVLAVPYRGGDSGRYRMNVAELHERGIDGSGVLVAVIDTGIDWMHPAFHDSLPTAEFMYARGVTITQDEMINLGTDENPDWRFAGRDVARTWPGQAWRGNPTNLPLNYPGTTIVRAGNDPMESAPFNFPPSHPQHAQAASAGWTSHGTHVSGSILARDFAGHGDVGLLDFDVSALGVAPGAMHIAYRNLWGGTPGAVTLRSIEYSYLDTADVVNMSLGGGVFMATEGNVMAINNIVLRNPYMVFVISAGNSGPHFVTGGNPGSSTMAISVSAFSEPRTGVLFQSPDLDVEDLLGTFMTPHTEAAMDDTTVQDRIVFTSATSNPIRRNADGSFNIFALPATPGSGGSAVIPVGGGTAADFEQLINIHGREAIEGSFVLVRRGYGLVAQGINAYNAGVAGIIQVTGPGQGTNSGGVRAVPMFSTHHEPGLAFAQALTAPENPQDRVATFYMNEFASEFEEMFLIDFSARGHVIFSYEIKPDLGAHGVATLSTFPRWSANLPYQTDDIPWDEHWRDPDNFISAYALSQGTSMSAPHVAGGVALMIQASIEAGERWTADEIRTRAMNTSYGVNLYSLSDRINDEYSVFAGARQMDVLAAIDATTVVAVNYPRLAHLAGRGFRQQPFEQYVQTGSFSFGGVGPGHSSTLTAEISSEEGGTYFLTQQWVNSRMSVPVEYRGTLDVPTTVIVEPESSTTFTATMTLPVDAPVSFRASGAVAATATAPARSAGAWEGEIYHEGYLVVSTDAAGENVVARLPFAAVAIPNATMAVNAVAGSNQITVQMQPTFPAGVGLPGIGSLGSIQASFVTAAANFLPAWQHADAVTVTASGPGNFVSQLGTISNTSVGATSVTFTITGTVPHTAGTINVEFGDRVFTEGILPGITGGTGFTAHNSRAISWAAPAVIPTANVTGVTPRGVLSELVEYANGLERENAPAAAWTRMLSARIAAQNVLNNPNASQAQIEAAIRNLTTMLNNLP